VKRRGAIIGLGNVAVQGHLPGWLARADVEIAAVTDARPRQRAVAAAALPGARWYDSPDALLAEEPLDFVDVCTPPRSHADLIAAALRRGCHVLCEKPLVSSPDELARVTRTADERGRVLQTVHNWHHAPILRQAGELLREGAIGPVHRAAWETLRMRPAAASDPGATNWRVDPALAGGGVLTDHGWHVFYVLRSWLGEARAVQATLERRRHVQWAVEDTARVRVDFDGASADVFLTWAAAERRNRVELTGADGTLRLEDDTVVLRRADGEQRWPCPPALSDGSTHPDWFGPVVERFLGAIAGADGADNLAEAAACVALEAAARESSHRGERLVAIAPRPAGVRRDPAA
jgi:predicted dehydrogenase